MLSSGARKIWAFIFALPLAYITTYLCASIVFTALFGPAFDVSIQPAGTKNDKSKGYETLINSPPLENLPAGWERRGTSTFAIGPNAAPINLTAKFSDADVVALLKYDFAGKIIVKSGNRSALIDLYASATNTYSLRPVGLYAILSPYGSISYASLFIISFTVIFIILNYIFNIKTVFSMITGTTSTSKNISYEPRLDHLRFVAAALVIVYHTFTITFGLGSSTNNPILAFVQQGHTGVALFMVLSGYLLAKIMIDKNVNYKDFLFARIFRIYPLYVFCIFLSVLPLRSSYSFIDILGMIFPFIHTYTSEKLPNFGHLWTVAVEFQFYLIMPFLMLFVTRYGARYLFGLLALSLLAKFQAWNQYGDVTNLSYITILGRIDQFLIGIALAVAVVRLDLGNRMRSAYLIPAVLFLVFVMGLFGSVGGLIGLYGSWVMIVWPTIEALAWGGLVVAYSLAQFRMPNTLTQVLARLGAISFSLYCVHYLVILTLQPVTIRLPGLALLEQMLWVSTLVIPVAIALSMATYGLIEQPFLAMRRQYTKKKQAPEKEQAHTAA